MNNITCRQQRFLSMGYVEGNKFLSSGDKIYLIGCSVAVKIAVTRFVVLVFIYFLLSSNAIALTATGSPSSCVNNTGIGTVAWTNPARAQSSNDSYATASLDGTISNYLYCTGYGFAIPSGSTIQGIAVNVERKSNSIANGGSNDTNVRLIKGGVVGSTDNATATLYTTTDFSEPHGSTSDLWGTTWTNTEINASNFGVAFAASKLSSTGAAHTVSIDYIQVVVTYLPPPTTTLATGTDPAAAIIAPDAAATDVDVFTLQTNTGTEAISSVTVNLSTNAGIALLAITDNTDTVLGSTSAPVTGSNTISVTGMTATTTLSSFKVRITPLSHVLMPVPPGASYAINAPVTAWVGTALHTGTDTDANSLTIDNTSPAAATSISGSAGALQNTLNWTTSVSSDFASSSGSVIYRWAAASAGSEVPTEGSTPTAGSTDGTATVACVISSSSATALSKTDGSGGSAGCTTTALTTGQSYTYKIFQKDANGNYNTGTTIGTFTPYGTVSASTSTVVANPTIVAADASAISTITVTLKDSAGTAVPNKTVILTTSSGSSIITTISGTSNASGVATFTVKDGTAEGPLTYTATDTTDAIVITQTAQVSFISYTCFSDNFTSLNIADWNVIGSGTGYYTPNIVNGRLRMTSASNNLKSMAQLQRWFPGASNRMILTFDYFAYGGSGADGLTVVLSDAATTPAAGGYGGSLGYAQYNNGSPISGFNGGWLGIGLDEWGNFPNTNEARTGYPAGWTPPTGANTAAGFYPNSIAVRSSGSGNTGYSLLANTGTLSPALWTNAASQTTPHKYRITFDHSNSINGFLTVERDTTGTGSSYTTIVPKFDVKAANSGQAAVPTNFYLSLTASTGGSTDIHEFDNMQVCATSMLPVGGGIHHIEITSSNSTGSTCQPITLTIKACANAACSGYVASDVTGTLTANTGVTWGAGAPNFTIPAGNITTTVSVTVPSGATTFGVNAATISPAATNTTTCNLGGTNACIFTGAASGFSLNVPNHISCANQAITLIGTGSGCAANFYAGARNVNFYTTYSNPASGTKQASVTFLNSSSQNITVPISTSSASPTTLTNVLFDSTSKANMTISYPDVGQMTLTAAATGMTAASASFITAPASFSFSNITAAPLVAGRNFSATITAKNQCATPSTTPNFGLEAAPETATLGFVKYRPIGTAAVNGFLTGALGSFSSGVASSNNLNWSEVGIIDLTATIASGNYLGSNVIYADGTTAAKGTTGNTGAVVGEFIPDHFNTTVTQGCSAGGFTYSAQPFTTIVTAMNGLATPSTTVNYDGSLNTTPNFAKIVTFSEVNGVAGTISSATVPASAFTAGIATVTPAFTFSTTPTAPAVIRIRATDTSNVSSATGTEGTTLIRSGRIKLSNAYGSELLDLAMPLTAQYWNGNAWITNSNDLCTTGVSLSLTDVNATDGLTTSELCAWDTGSLGNSGLGCSAAGAFAKQFSEPPIAGDFNLNFKATGSNNTGALNVTATVPSYLQFNWRGAGNANPTARATFGVYKGKDKQIYFRELY